jgi:hypothetical protein
MMPGAVSLVRQLFDFERAETRGGQLHAQLFELFLLQYAVRWAWEWGLFVRHVPAVVVPQGLAHYLDISPLLGGPGGLVNAALITAAALGVALGRWRRALLPLLLVALHLQYVARHCLGKASHGAQFVGMGLLILAVAAWCLPTPAARRRFELGGSLFCMGVGYTLAAFSKLAARGPSWVDGRHLWLWIGEKSIDQFSDSGQWQLNALQRLCLEHLWLATAVLAVGLLTELSGFLLWFRRTRVPITLALIGLHLGIYWTMGILFDAFIYQLIVLGLPWAALFDRLERDQRWKWSPGSAGVLAGGWRWWLSCSKAYASAIRRGSLKRGPEKVTPEGAGCCTAPSAGTKPPGTLMLG